MVSHPHLPRAQSPVEPVHRRMVDMAIKSESFTGLQRRAVSPPSPSSTHLVYMTSSSSPASSTTSPPSSPPPPPPTSEDIRAAATSTFLSKLAAVPVAWSKPIAALQPARPPPTPASAKPPPAAKTAEPPPVVPEPGPEPELEPENGDYEPVYYFFYGPLTDSTRLRAVLGLEESPRLRDAKVIGFTVSPFRSDQVLVDSETDDEVAGCALQILTAEQEDKLGCYETSSYEMEPCLICFTDGEEPLQVEGKTFMFSGKPEDLLAGDTPTETTNNNAKHIHDKTYLIPPDPKKAKTRESIDGDLPLRPKEELELSS